MGKAARPLQDEPAEGAKEAKEKKEFKMPTHEAYAIALRLAKEGGARKAHTEGSCPPYLWPVMEVAYLCRGRGIKVVNMTDAHETEAGLLVERTKGSNDNVVKWTPPRRPLRVRERLWRSVDEGALAQAWADFIAGVIEDGHLTAEQRFTLHGLKHRGITDKKGNKSDKRASGYKSAATLERYDHEVALVDPAVAPEYSGEFPGAGIRSA